jgi:hypothetical protein
VQTGLDRVATGEDATATAADRVQTGLDVTATAQARDTAQAAASNATAAEDAIDTALSTVSGETASVVAHAGDTDAHPLIQERLAVLIAQAQDLAGQAAQAVSGGRVTVQKGTAADPALALGVGAGLYQTADNQLSVVINGTEVARFSATGLAVTGGSVSSL